MNSYSVVIVTYQRMTYLRRCLESVRRSNFLAREVIVIVNGDDSETVSFMKGYFPEVILKVIPSATPGEARNLGARVATGEYILFLDDDAEIPDDYSSIAREFVASHPNCSIFGGPDSTSSSSSLYERSVGQTLKSPLATAHTRFRHRGASEAAPERCSDSSLILCALWFKRSLFESDGIHFDPRFFRNEENVYIHKALKLGFEVWYHPNLCAIHRRRNSPVALYKGVFGSAYYRMKSMILIPKSFSILFLVPSIFLLYLITLPWSYSVGAHYLLLPYLATVVLASAWFSSRSPIIFFYNIFNHLLFNIAYGIGALYYLVTHTLVRKKARGESYAK